MENLDGLSEGGWRLLIFLSVLLLLAVLELLRPRRQLQQSKTRRWITNLSFGGTGSLIARLMGMLAVPLAAIATAIWAEANNWGLFNQTSWPPLVEILLAIVILDFAIYVQHVASHKIPVLWQLHKVHHTDLDIDVTTAVRFHPIEIALSMLWKIVIVLAIGPTAFAVFLFEVLLNACAMFNHANIHLPRKLDAALRTVIVTPDMHRVHHSVHPNETDTNYGFNLAIWDRIFGTYIAQPKDGHTGMNIGLREYRGPEPTRFLWSLSLPFLSNKKQDSMTAQKEKS